MKLCKRCGKVKCLEGFNKNSNTKDGLQSWCRPCQIEVRDRDRVRVNDSIRTKDCLQCGETFPYLSRKKVFCSHNCKSNYHSKNSKRLEWEEKNRERKILYRAKASAKKKGIDFNLDLSDIEIPEFCPVLGLRLEVNRGKGYHFESPSLDKIDPKKGYVKGNVRVISARANLLKSDATVEELEKVLEDLRRLTDDS